MTESDVYERTVTLENDPVETLRETAQIAVEEYPETFSDPDERADALHEEVEYFLEKHLRSLSLVAQMVFLDEITEEYDLTNHDYEGEQARKSADTNGDWRENVLTGYAWHLVYEALAWEIEKQL